MDRQPTRYAHAEGHTDVTYSSDGKEILTCGSDGDIRVWNGLEDDDPRSVCVGEWALSLVLHDDRIFVSTDNHAVQAFTYPAIEKDGIVTRFTAPVTQICLTEKLQGLVCCSENMESRLCKKNDDKWSSTKMEHPGPVLGISLCPTAEYCMTSCGDGIYRIWNLNDCSIIKEIPALPKVNSFYAAKILGRSSFEPKTGKLLAYPSNKQIVLLETKNWQQKFVLSHPQITSEFSICSFSPCGNYLAASSITGQIVVWNVNEHKALGITDHPDSKNISSMSWNPLENGELAICDVTGQLATIINCYENAVVEIDDAMNDDIDENLDLIDIIEKEKENGEYNSDDAASDGEDDENTISLRKLKKEAMGMTNGDRERSRSRSRSKSRSRSPVVHYKTVTKQTPFQPSSTPVHLEHRYMCWNEIGIVRCHSSNDNNNIEVEFHDTTVHHSIHLNNHLNHTLASLSKSVLVLACEAPSKIVCIVLVGGSKEWSVTLSDLEEVLCVTATENAVAAATSNNFLRIYTPFGTQLHLISLLGTPVCLAGRMGFLDVIYHSAEPGQQDQYMAMDILQLQGTKLNCRRSGVKVALSNGALLKWFGCTERGSPITLDSTGVLRLYSSKSCLWIPVCDMVQHYKGVSDSYFIISVNEENQSVMAILCRGIPVPQTAPRPVVSKLPLKIPMCESDTEKGQLEEELRRQTILDTENDFQPHIETILKLFSLACRSEIEQRAVELIELLQDRRITTLAAKYASRLGKLHLADKLSNLHVELNENENHLESTENDDVQNSSLNDTEERDNSFIVPLRKPESEESVLKPIPIIKSSQNSRNPFRLSVTNENKSKSSHNPLSLTDRKLISDQNESENQKPAVTPPLPSESFPQWFVKNKEILQNENPDLTPSELTKIGIKTFKSLLSQNNTDSTPQKRKHSPEPENTPESSSITPKQSKLSAFVFQKRN